MAIRCYLREQKIHSFILASLRATVVIKLFIIDCSYIMYKYYIVVIFTGPLFYSVLDISEGDVITYFRSV